MKSQMEKNKEYLLEQIEELSSRPMTSSIAERLSVYRGAYKALCMDVVKDEQEEARAVSVYAEPETRGTEYESVVMSIPADKKHMKALLSIMADHMESLQLINRRAYDNVMARVRGLANE